MKRSSALFALCAVLVVAAPAHARAPRNPFGVTVVRFTKQTTPAQMRTAVKQAGGDVVTDLSAINALAVAPLSRDFAARIGANPHVVATFVDPVIAAAPGPDVDPSDGGVTGKNDPPLGSPGASFPDPWHDATSFWGVTNPEGILQWEDNRMDVRAAWSRTLGDRSVRVAVLDTGVQGSHKELLPNYDNQASANEIPCNTLVQDYGAATVQAFGLNDCSNGDTEGHGTWVASRIAGAANGFASNGIAPNVQIAGYKVAASGFGGLSSWVAAGLFDACSHGVDLVNLSLGGYLDPNDAADVQDYLFLTDAVAYCRARGTAVFSAAGNDHVRIDRVDVPLGGRSLRGVGLVDGGSGGFASTLPGSSSMAGSDLRGLLEVPGGLPGVVMVSATNNANGPAPADVPLRWTSHVGARDQLTYYSSYGSRIDLAAPGGARRFNIPRYDGGPGDILYGGWGSLGALVGSGLLCTDPATASPLTFACFKVQGAAFGWLQGTSMSAPSAVGVAALTLSTHPELRGRPDALLARLRVTARRDLTNYMGANDPTNFAASLTGAPCTTGYCHIDQVHPISFADAYGAGLVDAAGAAAP